MSWNGFISTASRWRTPGGPPEKPDYPTFADGHDEALIADAIAASAREGRWVTVDRATLDVPA